MEPVNCVVFRSNITKYDKEEIIKAISLFNGVDRIRTIDFSPINGQDITLFRQRNGLTQKAFCSKLGVSPKTLGKWENHKTEPNVIEQIGLKCIMNEIENEKVFGAMTVRSS